MVILRTCGVVAVLQITPESPLMQELKSVLTEMVELGIFETPQLVRTYEHMFRSSLSCHNASVAVANDREETGSDKRGSVAASSLESEDEVMMHLVKLL